MKSISSSSHLLTKDQLTQASLPFLSWCYFSSDDSEKLRRLEMLAQSDSQRRDAVVGNDIFREEKVELYEDKELIYREACQIIEMV